MKLYFAENWWIYRFSSRKRCHTRCAFQCIGRNVWSLTKIVVYFTNALFEWHYSCYLCVRAWTLIWRSSVLLKMLLWAVIRWEFDSYLVKASSYLLPHPSSPLRAGVSETTLLLLRLCSFRPVLACSNKSAQLNPTSFSSSLRSRPVQQHDPKQHHCISLVVSFGSCFSLFSHLINRKVFLSFRTEMGILSTLNLSISSYAMFAFHLRLLERKIRP